VRVDFTRLFVESTRRAARLKCCAAKYTLLRVHLARMRVISARMRVYLARMHVISARKRIDLARRRAK
jgi:hypothetical protein